MTPTTATRSRALSSRSLRTLCLLLLLVPLAVLIGPARAHSAPAGDTLRAGRGYRLAGGDFVGYYLTSHGDKVYCLDPRKAAPYTVSLTTVRRVGGTSGAVTEELAFALSRWGDARTSRQAAIESQVVNSIVGNAADVRRRMHALPSDASAEVSAHLRLARNLHGPYRVDLHLRGGSPGQSGLGSVRVRAASGHLVPSALLTLRGSSSVTVPRRMRTQTSGVGEFRYRVVDVGEVRVLATAGGLPDVGVRSSHPASGQQRMVSWTSTVSARASAAFAQRASGFSNAYACSTECAGRPSTRLTACAPASTMTSRVEYRIGSRVLTSTFRPARARTCHTVVAILHDRDRVTAVRRYRTAHGWSRAVRLSGSFTVDCPAVPAVAVTMVADCATASVHLELATRGSHGSWTPLVNRSAHRVVLVIGGASSRTISAGTGHTAQFDATAPCSAPQTYSFRAGVQRSDGKVNYGPSGSITVP